jgi:hypothetical protein
MTKKKPVPLTVLEASLSAYEANTEVCKEKFDEAAAEFRTQWTEYINELARKQCKGRLAAMDANRPVHVNFGGWGGHLYLSTSTKFNGHEKDSDGYALVTTDIKVKVPPKEFEKWKARAMKISRIRDSFSPRREFVRGVIQSNPQIAEQIVKLLNKAIAAEKAQKLANKTPKAKKTPKVKKTPKATASPSYPKAPF